MWHCRCAGTRKFRSCEENPGSACVPPALLTLSVGRPRPRGGRDARAPRILFTRSSSQGVLAFPSVVGPVSSCCAPIASLGRLSFNSIGPIRASRGITKCSKAVPSIDCLRATQFSVLVSFECSKHSHSREGGNPFFEVVGNMKSSKVDSRLRGNDCASK